MTRYELAADRTSVEVVAKATGHKFVPKGSGVSGGFAVDGGSLSDLRVSFRLAKLDPGDPLGRRELKKFLDLKSDPIAEAKIDGPVALTESPDGWLRGTGDVQVSIGQRRVTVPVQLEGRPPVARAKFTVTFTGLGYKPPKWLFLKVANELPVGVEAEVAAEGGPR